jgi:predicted metal-binding protein
MPLPELERVKELAVKSGFTRVGDLRVDTIRVREEVRAACADNVCRAYGSNWSCPPACGSLAECEARIRGYKTGLILQTTGLLEDSLDYESMTRIAGEHEDHCAAFAEAVKALCPSSLLLGAGACKRCKTCTYPDAPCRFPDRMITSMEAMGMVVSDVCKDNHLPYYYGPNTITYVGCALLR